MELVIPDEYLQDSRGEPFLLFDSGLSEDRILLFSTERNLSYMEHSRQWYIDGTFKVAPPLFHQVYTIHTGLQRRYNNDPNFALQLKQLAALAFVPENHVIASYEELIGSGFYTDNDNILLLVTNYFEDT
ncbi:hypothetical protein RN001_000406 [Aquatica leii]|uniref:Uncharacterized protein n=1 Tax=Aquatica leii TaxID=1421715 RepID=A0AAN7Q9L9_9COLE|nr:hypothetical protein RN001_000406 [Aquatica leii]